MRYVLLFSVDTAIPGPDVYALRDWLRHINLPIEALNDGPITVDTDERSAFTTTNKTGNWYRAVDIVDLPDRLWAALTAAGAIWCADPTHHGCGQRLDIGGRHATPDAATGPPDEDPWGELAVPFVVTQAHGGDYDTETFEAGYWLGRVDVTLEQGKTLGAPYLLFPMLPAGILRQLHLQGMYRGYPIVKHELHDTAPDWCAVTFTRGTDL